MDRLSPDDDPNLAQCRPSKGIGDPKGTIFQPNHVSLKMAESSPMGPVNSGSHQPRSDAEVVSGSKSFFVLFIHF